MKKSYKKNVAVIVFLVVLLMLYVVSAEVVIASIIDYSILFLTKLFPVSLIFFIFSNLLIEYGLIQLCSYYFNVNTSSLYVLIISMISGFPSGAKYTKELYNKGLIDLDEANNIIMYSHFPNPLFVLGSVLIVLNDKSLCVKLLISLILSNIIIFMFTKRSKKINFDNCIPCKNFSLVLGKSVTNAFDTLLLIYGTSLFFYLIATVITKYVFLGNNGFILLNGFFDLTKGVFSTTLIGNVYIRLIYILLFISFGGLSIHMQVKSILADTPIRYKYFFKGRIVGTILALIILLLLLMI